MDWETLRTLVREAEIDFDELTGNITEAVDALGPVTVAQVLDRHPATQGLASAVGLYVLGTRYGTVADGGEQITWTHDGVTTRAILSPTYRFEERADDWR